MTKQSTVFGAGGGGGNELPNLTLGDSIAKMNIQSDPTTVATVSLDFRYLPGFIGDGDYIRLPSTNGDFLEYYDNASVLQWSYEIIDFVPVGTDRRWVQIEKKNNLIYILGAAGSTKKMKMWTVDQAGVTTDLNGVDATYVNLTAAPDWNLDTKTTNSSAAVFDLANDRVLVTVLSAANVISVGVWTISTGATVYDFSLGNSPGQNFQGVTCLAQNLILFYDSCDITRIIQIADADSGGRFSHYRQTNISKGSNGSAFTKIWRGWQEQVNARSSLKCIFWEDGYWFAEVTGDTTIRDSPRYFPKDEFEEAMAQTYAMAIGGEL